MPEEKVHHRDRIDMTKVDHFVEFINRPYFYQEVSYGTKFLKLDSGETIEMPNVVCTVTPSTMISQYVQFCQEEKFEPLSRNTFAFYDGTHDESVLLACVKQMGIRP